MKKVLLLSLVLAGCASTPQPQLTDSHYNSVAAHTVIPQKCVEKGWLPASVAATAVTLAQTNVRAWSMDIERLSAVQQQYATGVLKLTPELCKGWEVGILAQAQQAEQQQANVQYQREEAQRLADKMAAPTGRTYCNNIGGYMLCNSY